MHIELKMQSLGMDGEICDDCKKKIPRGENINMVVYEDGKPYGRLDDKCVEKLKQKCKRAKVSA